MLADEAAVISRERDLPHGTPVTSVVGSTRSREASRSAASAKRPRNSTESRCRSSITAAHSSRAAHPEPSTGTPAERARCRRSPNGGHQFLTFEVAKHAINLADIELGPGDTH